ncbi:flap endonuclease 1 [Hamiltosporidium tvaerminnensis]|uniref:Flap endonuclease 1 n=2 Tax=Hamiltosporidium TaxID=1176354 RepID=A0A4V2JWN2_9MICR|nr:flap endonuclease 1 [Hamiltosporidium magnivora]TBU17866.1 flap endonuclease 1 [Hamiltosporidium tvaerminnensis]
MGIKQLSQVILKYNKQSIRERSIGYYSGKRIAIDASLCLYQFLIAVRSEGMVLNAADGETTSHLVGLFYRSIRLIENGIKPIFVFDGKPPHMKFEELQKRSEKRIKADEEYVKAVEKGDLGKMEMYDKRKTKVTIKHVEDCKKLLSYMGIPYVNAPSEAEAFCAYLCINKHVDAVGTEDMDALTFATPILLRNLTASESKKLPIKEYNFKGILRDLELTDSEFIDMCILLGCDYCESIKGIGPQKALSLIKKYQNIENILQNETSLEIPDEWKYKDARIIFEELVNLPCEEELPNFKYGAVNKEAIIDFLVVKNGFSEERVKKGLERLILAQKKGKTQRLDDFFKAK